jgi:hypothetical protein
MDYLSNQTIKNISIFLFTFYLFSCGSSEVDNWERKEGKYYVKGSNELFTGVIKSNGVLKYHANVLNGFYHGIYRRYDNDNVLLEELMYNNGKKHGISRTRVTSNSSFIEISWENGKIKTEPIQDEQPSNQSTYSNPCEDLAGNYKGEGNDETFDAKTMKFVKTGGKTEEYLKINDDCSVYYRESTPSRGLVGEGIGTVNKTRDKLNIYLGDDLGYFTPSIIIENDSDGNKMIKFYNSHTNEIHFILKKE